MKALLPLLIAVTGLTGAAALADDLGRLLEPVYVPNSNAARPALVSAKAAGHMVTETELLDRIEKELARQFSLDGELRLNFGRHWQSIRVPSEDWQLTLTDLPIGGLTRSFMLRIRVSSADRVWADQQLVVEAQLWKPVLVATRPLERGDTLDRSSVEMQTIDTLRERSTPVPANTKIEAQELLQNVAQGAALTWKDIALAPLVRKGAMVDVTATGGGISVTMKAQAQTTGGAGDTVTVRNMESRKDFQARVIDRNSVRVNF